MCFSSARVVIESSANNKRHRRGSLVIMGSDKEEADLTWMDLIKSETFKMVTRCPSPRMAAPATFLTLCNWPPNDLTTTCWVDKKPLTRKAMRFSTTDRMTTGILASNHWEASCK